MPSLLRAPPPRPCRRAALEAEVRAQLEAEHSWWRDDAGCPPNLRTVGSKAEFKSLITEAPAGQLVVCDYLKPSCGACRRMHPKLQQIAAQNPDVLIVKVGAGRPARLLHAGAGRAAARGKPGAPARRLEAGCRC